MAQTIPVSRSFDRGIVRDAPRDLLGPDQAYGLVDYVQENGAPLRRRGSWGFANAAGTGGTSSRVLYPLWFPNTLHGIPELLLIGNAGDLWIDPYMDNTTLPTNVGTLYNPVGVSPPAYIAAPPFLYRDVAVFPMGNTYVHASGGGGLPPLPGGGASAGTVRTYDGATLGSLANAPQAGLGCAFGEWLCLATGYNAGSSYTRRMWFSSPGDPNTWPANNSIDLPEQPVALVARSNQIYVLGNSGFHIITGTIPPPGGDFILRKFVFQQGTPWPDAVVSTKDFVIFANPNGVWRTDGGMLVELTARAGISAYWRESVRALMAQTTSTVLMKASAGMFRGRCFITLLLYNSSTNAPVSSQTFVYSLDNESFSEFSNISAFSYANRYGGLTSQSGTVDKGTEELFWVPFGSTNKRAARISNAFASDVSTSSQDPAVSGGTVAKNVLPVLETGIYKMGNETEKRFHYLYLTYDIRSTGGSTPTLQVEKITDPAGSYQTLGESFLTTTAQRRARVRTYAKSAGIGFRLTQTAASADTRIGALELGAHGMESSRR